MRRGACLRRAPAGDAGSRDVFWGGDFYVEVYHPAYLPLIARRAGAFFSHLPGYAAFSVLVGAPAALLAGALRRDETLVLRLTALPGVVLLAGLGAVLGGEARRAGRPAGCWWSSSARAVRSPTRRCSTATRRTSSRARPRCSPCSPPAGAARGDAVVLLVVAVAAKQWAVLAIAAGGARGARARAADRGARRRGRRRDRVRPGPARAGGGGEPDLDRRPLPSPPAVVAARHPGARGVHRRGPRRAHRRPAGSRS